MALPLITEVQARYSIPTLTQLTNQDNTTQQAITTALLQDACDDAEGRFYGETGVSYEDATSASAVAANAAAAKLAVMAAVSTTLYVLFQYRAKPSSPDLKAQEADALAGLARYRSVAGAESMAGPATNSNWIPEPTPATAPPFEPGRLTNMVPRLATPGGGSYGSVSEFS